MIFGLFCGDNFQGVGRNRFGLDFPKYLAPLNMLHLLNVWLLWLLALSAATVSRPLESPRTETDHIARSESVLYIIGI